MDINENENKENITATEENSQPVENTEEPAEESAENLQAESRQVENFAQENFRQPEAPVYTVDASAKTKRKKSGKGIWITISAVLVALCLISTSFAVAFAINGNTGSFTLPTPSTPEYAPLTATSTDDLLTVPQVYEKIKESVVDIIIQTADGSGFASGIIYTADGYIVTNAHVVDSATSITVRLLNGNEYPAEIIGYDSYTEVAVIKIDATGLTPAEFGESSKLVVGEEVVAIGTPYDLSLTHTLSVGYVSALRDSFTFEDLGLTLDLVQHTASINPGNSGGPLLNMYGQVVGINVIKIIDGYENIGFALQIDSVLPIVETLMNNGKVERPQIGIKGYTDSSIGGVTVAEIVKGGAADGTDLKVGDIITKIDGVRVKTIEELITRLGGYNAGDEVELSILRDVEVVTVKIKLQEASD